MKLTPQDQSALVATGSVMAVLTTRCLAGLSTSVQDIVDACLVSRSDAELLLKACGQSARERCDAACERIRQGVG